MTEHDINSMVTEMLIDTVRKDNIVPGFERVFFGPLGFAEAFFECWLERCWQKKNAKWLLMDLTRNRKRKDGE